MYLVYIFRFYGRFVSSLSYYTRFVRLNSEFLSGKYGFPFGRLDTPLTPCARLTQVPFQKSRPSVQLHLNNSRLPSTTTVTSSTYSITHHLGFDFPPDVPDTDGSP